jgi:nucleoside-diphosphate-sugar epimerase
MTIQESSMTTTPKRVIVLGSGGVVGKKLVPFLKEQGIETLGLSRQDCNLLEDKSVDILAQTLQPNDQVVFLTAVTPDKGRGTKALIDNLTILENVSQALQKSSVAQFILFSSEAIYPTTSDLIHEETSLAPADLYGCMHLARENHLRSLKVPLTIIRPTLIYGVGDTHNSYGPNRFLKEALSEGKITLFGEGEEKRSHVFVDDVVRFVEKVLRHRNIDSINMCPSPSISFMEIAQAIREVLPNIEMITKPRGSEITHRYFDNTLLHQTFPDFSFTDIKAGIQKMVTESSQ